MPKKTKKTHDADELVRKNQRMGLIVLIVVGAMVGVSFAAVPLYGLFCRVTGFGGTTQVSEAWPDHVLERQVTVRFNASVAPNMPWRFVPETKEVTLHVGERGFASFSAYNPESRKTGGMAIYNVTPLKVGKYFHKVQCFCFDEQFLEPRQRVSMPVMFFVDPSMNDDPNMNDVETITLSYTFYNADSPDLESGPEGIYNSGDSDINVSN